MLFWLVGIPIFWSMGYGYIYIYSRMQTMGYDQQFLVGGWTLPPLENMTSSCFYRCYVYHSQSWVVYFYFLPTLIVINSDTTHILIFWSMVGLPINMWYWLVFEPYPSEKYDFVSWDDDIPNWMESHKSHVLNHQAVFVYLWSKHVATSTNTWWFRNGVFLNSGSTICRRCPDSDLRSPSSTYPL